MIKRRNLGIPESKNMGKYKQVFPLLEFSKLYVKVKEKIITLKWLEMYAEEIFKTIINWSR